MSASSEVRRYEVRKFVYCDMPFNGSWFLIEGDYISQQQLSLSEIHDGSKLKMWFIFL